MGNDCITTSCCDNSGSIVTTDSPFIGYTDINPCTTNDWIVPGTVYAKNFEVVQNADEIPEDYSNDPEETKTHLVYTLPYPGMSQKNLDMYVRDDMLVIDNDRSSKFVKVGKIEIIVDWSICNRDDVKAKCEDGILTIAIAKIQEDKTIIIR